MLHQFFLHTLLKNRHPERSAAKSKDPDIPRPIETLRTSSNRTRFCFFRYLFLPKNCQAPSSKNPRKHMKTNSQ